MCRKWEGNLARCLTDSSAVSVAVNRQSQHTVTVPTVLLSQFLYTEVVRGLLGPISVHFPRAQNSKKGGCSVAPPKKGGQEPPVMLVLVSRHFDAKQGCQLREQKNNIFERVFAQARARAIL